MAQSFLPFRFTFLNLADHSFCFCVFSNFLLLYINSATYANSAGPPGVEEEEVTRTTRARVQCDTLNDDVPRADLFPEEVG